MRLANARLVDLSDGTAAGPEDLWVSRGRLARCPALDDDSVVDLDGRFVIPGLWDAHVHMTQWAMARRRIDLSATRSTREVLDTLAGELRRRPGWATDPVVGVGVRSSGWPDVPTGEQLDSLSPDVAVVVLSSDLHAAWVNGAAIDQLRLERLRPGRVLEQDAFDVQLALNETVSASGLDRDQWVREAARGASALGLVGITDVENSDNLADWTRRMDAGFTELRVRAAVWPDLLGDRERARLRTGDAIGSSGLLVQGPLKVIVDGSIMAGTAWCRSPYGTPPTTGRCNTAPGELAELTGRAAAAGLDCALHAIGDAAIDASIDAFSASGARGSIEHAHLATPDQAQRMAQLGITASVQPQHLPDDRDPCERLWPGRAALPLGMLRDAGVRLAVGSDAPVVPLSPWHAIEYAVTRTGDPRPAWHPGERLTLAEALQASTGGVRRLVPGAPADLVALDANPFELDPSQLHTVTSALTVVAGRVVHDAR